MKLKLIAILAATTFAFPSVGFAQNNKIQMSAVNKTITHDLTDSQLSKLNGKYPFDKGVMAILSPYLKKLLGPKWKEFEANLHTSSPMVFANHALVGSGFFGPDSAAFEFRSSSAGVLPGVVIAAIKDSGEKKCTDYGPVNAGYLCEIMDR